MKLTKAVIPAAGLGSRMLPFSSAVPKELLPVGTMPVFQYVLSEAYRAGIETIVLVNAAWKTALDDYLSLDRGRLASILGTEKERMLDSLMQLARAMEIVSVDQPEPRGLGHAVSMANPIVQDEPFAVLLPDEIILQSPGVVADLINASDDTTGAIAVIEVPREKTSSYGIVAVDNDGSEAPGITAMVEKPDPADAPTNLAIVGRYVFPQGFRSALQDLQPGAGGELQLTDAMRDNLDQFPLRAVRVSGRRFDTGNPAAYAACWQAYLDAPEAFHEATRL